MLDTLKRLLAVPEDADERVRYCENAQGAAVVALNILLILAATATIVLSGTTVGWLLGVVILVASYLLGKLR